MKILFLLSSLEPAGSETYCLALARAWEKRHQVFWISDRLFYGEEPFQPMPIHRKAIPGGVINTLRVAGFIRRHKIQIIHSHSRRSHWVAAQAAALTRIPHVTTVHQPLPVHFFSRLFPCLGDQAIAIDEAVEEQLGRRFRRRADSVSLIRNGIELAKFVPSPSPAYRDKRVLLLGRLSGGRWEAFKLFLDALRRAARNLPPTVFQIAGRIPSDRAPELTVTFQKLQAEIAPSKIESLGWVHDLPSVLRSVDLVVAGGRSALESLATAKPVIILGEGGILGTFSPETLQEALRTNFGDHLSPKQWPVLKLETGLRELLGSPQRSLELGHWGRSQVEKYYDVRNVAGEVEKVYERVIGLDCKD